jgi:predicted cupin superfamily sugar epimerase
MTRLPFLLTAVLGLTGCYAAIPKPPNAREIRSPQTYDPTPINQRTAQEVITQLNLIPNVEKGYYVETFRDTANVTANRSASTAIYYLLEGAEGYSNWHRVDAVEVWHYYAGAPLTLSLALDDGSPVREMNLGPDVFAGQQPQVAIGKWEWQRARSWGDWTLVGTTGMFESGCIGVSTNGRLLLSCPGVRPSWIRSCGAWLGAEVVVRQYNAG